MTSTMPRSASRRTRSPVRISSQAIPSRNRSMAGTPGGGAPASVEHSLVAVAESHRLAPSVHCEPSSRAALTPHCGSGRVGMVGSWWCRERSKSGSPGASME